VNKIEFTKRFETQRSIKNSNRQRRVGWRRATLVAVSMCLIAAAAQAGKSHYEQVDIASNRPLVPNHVDPRLVNPWGLVFSPTGLLYVADNGTGLSTIYSPSGIPIPFSIRVPSPSGSSGVPTGMVFNATHAFKILNGGDMVPATLLFATEDGGIAGWYEPSAPSHAVIATDRSVANSVYKGLAMGNVNGHFRLYATDFHNAHVDVFDENFALIADPAAFVDPTIPAGYAPFGIANVDRSIVVTYAKQKPPDNDDDDAGLGHGFVDLFRADGTLVRRIASEGLLDSPWGIALAPNGFGPFSGTLLIGNFGDGRINGFSLDGQFLGTLGDENGKPIVIDGLWGLTFLPPIEGTGVSPETRLYFSSGPADESNGVLGFLRSIGPLN
jgi:uncharacterized protein (TIGR03118 family)